MATDNSSPSWRPVPGFPGYEVSDTGLVRSWKKRRNCAPIPTEPRLLTPQRWGGPYAQVLLRNDDGPKAMHVHRLVLLAFAGPADGRVARHLDGDPSNNNLNNLAWGTYKENSADQVRHGTSHLGDRHPLAKLTEAKVREIMASDESGASLSRRMGVCTSAIYNVRQGWTWNHVTGLPDRRAM